MERNPSVGVEMHACLCAHLSRHCYIAMFSEKRQSFTIFVLCFDLCLHLKNKGTKFISTNVLSHVSYLIVIDLKGQKSFIP